jgi:hypothetical protein
LVDAGKSTRLHYNILRKWWQEESSNLYRFVSLETIAELNEGNYPKKIEISGFVNTLEKLEPGILKGQGGFEEEENARNASG